MLVVHLWTCFFFAHREFNSDFFQKKPPVLEYFPSKLQVLPLRRQGNWGGFFNHYIFDIFRNYIFSFLVMKARCICRHLKHTVAFKKIHEYANGV